LLPVHAKGVVTGHGELDTGPGDVVVIGVRSSVGRPAERNWNASRNREVVIGKTKLERIAAVQQCSATDAVDEEAKVTADVDGSLAYGQRHAQGSKAGAGERDGIGEAGRGLSGYRDRGGLWPPAAGNYVSFHLSTPHGRSDAVAEQTGPVRVAGNAGERGVIGE